ncbi:MAG: carbohydrate ABC transporter permease [Bacilli bacterium]|nr:carbohydrate ABC transporter permease [Bacilli bacterium]
MKEKHIRELINDNEVTIVKKRKKTIYEKIIYYVFGTILSLIFVFPLIYMIAASTKSEIAIANDAGTIRMFIPDFAHFSSIFDNYATLFNGKYEVGRHALNSFIYAGITIVLNILINGMAAYAICKLRFPGKAFFNFIIMFLIIVPVESSIIPLYLICRSMLGFVDKFSILAIICPASISVFNIFLFIQFFSSIPKEFEEAARMDGANTFQVFLKVILPLSKPILATVAVFCFIGVWNDYLWPTMVLPKEAWPIQATLTVINSDPAAETGQKMASLVITSIPIFIVYVAAQKYIVKGFGAGGLKL